MNILRRIKRYVDTAITRHQNAKIVSEALASTGLTGPDAQRLKILLESAVDEIEPRERTPEVKKFQAMILARTFQKLLVLDNIVSIQPIPSPVGLVYMFEQGQGELKVTTTTAAAKTRRLSASWSAEAKQDLAAFHDIDFELELQKVIGSEVFNEIVAEVLQVITSASKMPIDYTLDLSEPAHYTHLCTAFNRASSYIASTTRRGPGNIIIASPDVIAALQQTPGMQYTAPMGNKHPGESLSHAGCLHTSSGKLAYTLYVTMLPQFIDGNVHKAILMYSGTSQLDRAFVYAPYKLVSDGGIAIDPGTFQPQQRFFNRHDTVTSPHASSYVQTFNITIVDK